MGEGLGHRASPARRSAFLDVVDLAGCVTVCLRADPYTLWLATQKSLPSQLVAPLVRLLEVLFLSSPALPSFHREVAVPWVQKFALGLMAWSTTSTSSQQTIVCSSSLYLE